MDAGIAIAVVVVLIGLILLGRMPKIVQQYEQGIIFRFGRVLPGIRGAGLTWIRPIGDKMVKVNRQIVAMGVPAQEGITRDNVSVRVDAVVYFKVVDPIKSTINVYDYQNAISQRAQTSLRSIIGQSEMDELLADRDTVNRRLAGIIDEGTEIPWGVKVETVEIKDVSLPEGMKRSMSRQAEAERERRARIITADGEFQASKRLAAAANVMARDPAALQLRLLQTVVEVAGERNSTLVMPIPVELLRFFDRFTPGTVDPATSAGGAAAAAEREEEVDDEVKALEGQARADANSLADAAGSAIENPANGPAAIGNAADALDIPDVPDIPALSPEEKGDLGTVHHGSRGLPDSQPDGPPDGHSEGRDQTGGDESSPD